MIRNEKGFVYPLALILLVITSFLLIIHTELYLSEKRTLHEGKALLKQEYYFMNSLQTVELKLKNEEFAPHGQFQYADGLVEYSVKEIAPSLYEIQLIIKMPSHKDTIGYGYYDSDLQQIIKWVERV